jgi:hypothetical protein
MQTDPTARHSPIGSFQRADYLVHLARDPVATARGVRSPALHPDRHCAQHRAPRGVGQGARRPAWSATTLQSHLGWQPSRFLTDRGEAERAFQLAERLGSVNAAAKELDTTWPSLRKAFTRHGLGMPTRNPEAVRQRTIAAARRRSGRPATPGLDPVFVALNLGALPAREQPAPSCMHGSAATRSTPSWALPWWSSCTARAGPANQPPGPGRSSAGPTAATG